MADRLERLLAAAEREGHHLSGTGYRTFPEQQRLRTINGCREVMRGTDCRIPTAIPGTSMHEKGLAVDFKCGGATMQKGMKCYTWMGDHARDYGLFNFPVEDWHWSTNGH